MMIGASHLDVLSVALKVWRGDVNTPTRIGSGLTSVDIELIRGWRSRENTQINSFVRIDNVGKTTLKID